MNAMRQYVNRTRIIRRAGLRTAIGFCVLGWLSASLAGPLVVTGTGTVSADSLGDPSRATAVSDARKTRVLGAYGKLPLHFEVNAGQFHESVKFGTRGRGYEVFLNGTETVLILRKQRAVPTEHEAQREWISRRPRERLRDAANEAAEPALVVRMRFEGANADPEVVGESPLPGKSHYFVGNDPAQWRTNVAHQARVRYLSVYPGIDMVYYGSEGRLEYDWIVAPGVDPHRIVAVFDGADRVSVAANGDLVIDTPIGAIRQEKPVLYQEIGGKRLPFSDAAAARAAVAMRGKR